MFISKMIFKKNSNQRNEFLKMFENEYGLHQAVWNLFGDRPDRERDFLYRLEDVGKWPVVYAISNRRPVDFNELWDVETKAYVPQIKIDMRFGFTVRVNPTRKREGKRHDVVMDQKHKICLVDSGKEVKKLLSELVTETCVEWLKERSEKNGFDIISMRADGYRQNRFTKRKGGLPVRYSTVDFNGVLRVDDEKLFQKMLFCGLGPEKAFGCGLMLIRKV